MSFLSILLFISAFYFAHGRPDATATSAVPVATATNAVPIATATNAVPIATATSAVTVATATNAVPVATATSSVPVATADPTPTADVVKSSEVPPDDSQSSEQYGQFEEETNSFIDAMSLAIDNFMLPIMSDLTEEKRDQAKMMAIDGFSGFFNYIAHGRPDATATSAVPVATATNAVPIATATNAVPIATATSAVTVATATNAVPVATATSSVPVATADPTPTADVVKSSEVPPDDSQSSEQYGQFEEETNSFIDAMSLAIDNFMLPIMSDLTEEKRDQAKMMAIDGFSGFFNYIIFLYKNADNNTSFSSDFSLDNSDITVEFDSLEPMDEDSVFIPSTTTSKVETTAEAEVKPVVDKIPDSETNPTSKEEKTE